MAVDNIKKGSGGIAGLCIGSTEVSKAYLGSTLVYENCGSRDYSLEYFTVEALSSGVVSLRGASFTQPADLWYRLNGGEWEMSVVDLNGAIAEVDVVTGDIVEFKGAPTTTSLNSVIYPFGMMQTTASYNVYGNLKSLFVADPTSQYDLTGLLSVSVNIFQGFFQGTAIADASNLVLLPLATNATYYRMFRNDTSLTGSPKLEDATLTASCYEQMFDGCSSLSNVTCLATSISATDCITGWLNGTAASGTLHCASTMTSSWIPGTNIPSGWTVQSI